MARKSYKAEVNVRAAEDACEEEKEAAKAAAVVCEACNRGGYDEHLLNLITYTMCNANVVSGIKDMVKRQDVAEEWLRDNVPHVFIEHVTL